MVKEKKNILEKKKKTLTNSMKAECIKLYDSGWKNSDLMKKYGLSSSTIASIYSKKGRATAKMVKDNLVSMHCTVNNTFLKPPVMNDLETILYQYINMNLERTFYLNEKVICEKAVQVFNYLMDPEKGFFTIDGQRKEKGVPIPIVNQREAMGKAYELDPDDPDFDGFDNVTDTDTERAIVTSREISTHQTNVANSLSDNVTVLENNDNDLESNVTRLSDVMSIQSPSTSASNDTNSAGSQISIRKYNFKASHGWYTRCVTNRFGYKWNKKHGEADSADMEAANKFVPEITKFILKYFDGPQYIYNVDEMALYYKKILNCCIDTQDKKKTNERIYTK